MKPILFISSRKENLSELQTCMKKLKLIDSEDPNKWIGSDCIVVIHLYHFTVKNKEIPDKKIEYYQELIRCIKYLMTFSQVSQESNCDVVILNADKIVRIGDLVFCHYRMMSDNVDSLSNHLALTYDNFDDIQAQQKIFHKQFYRNIAQKSGLPDEGTVHFFNSMIIAVSDEVKLITVKRCHCSSEAYSHTLCGKITEGSEKSVVMTIC